MAELTTAAILDCFDVNAGDDGRWRANNLDLDYHRIFGGQLLGQAIVAATRSAEDKTVRSMSVLFPREGRSDNELILDVDECQTGRAFAARRVTAAHEGKVFFLAQLSLHVAEDGPEHADPMPDVGSPDDAEPGDLTMVPFETRVVGGVDLADPAAAPADYAFWMRAGDVEVGDDPALHQALVAYATDLTVIGTALRPHEGLSQASAQVTLHTAVTGHHMWFHRPFRADDWCLVTQHAPVTAGARAFGQGHVHDAAGHLVASFAQESMIRPIVS